MMTRDLSTTSSLRDRVVSRALSWSIAGLLAGCAVADAPAAPGLTLRFAAMDGGCQPTSNGTNTVPESIDTLVVVLKAAGLEPRTVRASRASVVQAGSWLVKGIPITEDLDVEVYGCDATGAVRFAGQSNDARVESQQETTLRAFLLPVDKVACTGDDGLDDGSGAQAAGKVPDASSGLPKAAALAAAAAMASGDVLITGGIGEWTSEKQPGVATRETARYDHHTGHFRRGPLMREARVWHNAIAVSDHHVLVVGGVTSVNALSSKSGVATSVLVPNDIAKTLPSDAAEIIDVRLDAGGQPKISVVSAADVGAGANLLASALKVGADVLFAGGMNTAGAPVSAATRLTGLADVATGAAGTSTAIAMAVGRVRPGLVALDDGRVIIWGGANSGKIEDMGEVLDAGAIKTKKLKITGDADLLKLAELATAGPAVTLLSQTGTEAAFLVVGGMPFLSPLSATKAPSYVVVLNRATGEAQVKPATAGGKTIYGGVGMALTRSPDGHVVLAGGLVALSGAAPCDAAAAECLLGQVLLLDGKVDTTGAKVDLTATATLDLGAGQFGVAAAPLPMGVLLAGGQSAVVAKIAAGKSALTSTSRVLIASPANGAAICAK